ncbi:hypothetical protein H0E87_001780, partial [Populus deltoides]
IVLIFTEYLVVKILSCADGQELLAKLPGRTDNEIKNYWRTHMRKKAQERKGAMSPSLSSSNCSSSSNTTTVNSSPLPRTGETSFYDTGGLEQVALAGKNGEAVQGGEKGYSMDDIWKDIEKNY